VEDEDSCGKSVGVLGENPQEHRDEELTNRSQKAESSTEINRGN
jgi:hypothetical protein